MENNTKNMFKPILMKLASSNFWQNLMTGILSTIGAALIMGIFIMATKVYSFEIEIGDIKKDMEKMHQ
jgi:hypothetical protein